VLFFLVALQYTTASAQSSSGITFFPSFSIRQETGVAVGDSTSYPMNIRAGFKTAGNWFFGMMYSSVAGSGPTTTNEVSYGNSVGYFAGPVGVIATYFLVSSTNEYGPDGRVARTGGSGYQFDLSATFRVAEGMALGPVLSFKSLSYKTSEDSTGIHNTGHTESFIWPSFGLLVSF